MRTYKKLTAKQLTKVRALTKKGKSQKDIARTLGVSKQRISTAQKTAGVGKRVAGDFWKAVKTEQGLTESTWKEATYHIYHSKKYGTKRAARAGKKWKSVEERQASMRALRQEFDTEELQKHIDEEMAEYQYGRS